eukprot:Hpha_TRINITY_DN30143_c0_g1::TRINITY_DN30143_c0_g1_i1::g.110705::m.110705
MPLYSPAHHLTLNLFLVPRILHPRTVFVQVPWGEDGLTLGVRQRKIVLNGTKARSLQDFDIYDAAVLPACQRQHLFEVLCRGVLSLTFKRVCVVHYVRGDVDTTHLRPEETCGRHAGQYVWWEYRHTRLLRQRHPQRTGDGHQTPGHLVRTGSASKSNSSETVCCPSHARQGGRVSSGQCYLLRHLLRASSRIVPQDSMRTGDGALTCFYIGTCTGHYSRDVWPQTLRSCCESTHDGLATDNHDQPDGHISAYFSNLAPPVTLCQGCNELVAPASSRRAYYRHDGLAPGEGPQHRLRERVRSGPRSCLLEIVDWRKAHGVDQQTPGSLLLQDELRPRGRGKEHSPRPAEAYHWSLLEEDSAVDTDSETRHFSLVATERE